MKILVTGTDGYIGMRLASWLNAAGHEVAGLDTGLCRDGCLCLDPLAMPIGREVFNVGRTDENFRIRETAQIVAQAFPGCEVSAGPPSQDNRSYRVSFAKIESKLPGFKARWTAPKGAEELRRLFERIEFTQETFEFRAFTRLKQLKYLLRSEQVDQDLFWKSR